MVEFTLPQYAAFMFLGFMATEGAVEYILGILFQHVAALRQFEWTLRYASLAAGVFFAFVYGLDLPNVWLELPASPVGIVMTGIVIGRGANGVHNVASKVSAWLGRKAF